MEPSATTATDSGATLKKQVEDQTWLREKQKQFMNLSTSNYQIMETMMKELADPDVSQAKITTLQMLMEQRLQLTAMISNMIKSFGEAMRSIINNFR